MTRSYFTFVAVAIALLSFSCSGSEEKNKIPEGEQAYNEFRSFVVATEEDAESEEQIDIKDTTIARQEIDSLRSQYDTLTLRVDKYVTQYIPPQREELLDLRERFKSAVDKKKQKNEEASRRYELRRKLLGIEISSDDLTEITPANIKTVYLNFVNTVSQEMSAYSESDWQLIEGFWNALNNRKSELQDKIEPADQRIIADKQEEFLVLNKRRS
ncbi:hypothetical protein [Botryobacter ruber]|uniref:hypothetical protein n=1 Tax=Botryobacter ruber TaxID=2171629 RepID=UPI000F653F57|nr:hypothetical protein [Botryobacter ruber]